MQKIVIIADSFLDRDPRVQVQIQALIDDYELICVGRSHPRVEGVEFIEYAKKPLVWYRIFFKLIVKTAKIIGNFKLKLAFTLRNRILVSQLSKIEFDIIIVNDLIPISIVNLLKRKGLKFKVYLDLHEWAFGQHISNKSDNELFYLIELSKKYCNYITTVNDPIKKLYHDKCEMHVNDVVMNLPDFNDLHPKKINQHNIRLVHHGIYAEKRDLDNLVDILDKLDDRFTLDFYFINKESNSTKKFIQKYHKNPRLKFPDPVPTKKLPFILNEYDIGLFPLSEKYENYRFALPNKFFEFIQARLCIAIWPSVEMKNLLNEYHLGLVSVAFNVDELAMLLNNSSIEDLYCYKLNSHKAASILHSESSIRKIRVGIEACIN